MKETWIDESFVTWLRTELSGGKTAGSGMDFLTLETLADSDRKGIEGSGVIAPFILNLGDIPPLPSMPSRSESASFSINSLNPELNPSCYLLALLGAHHFLHVSKIRVNY